MIKIKKRKNCRLCGSYDLKLAVKLESIPPQELYFDTYEEAIKADSFPVDIYFCEGCSHVQQVDILDSSTLWDSYTYESANSSGMIQHFEDFFCEIKNDIHNEGYVLDIGSNDGSLLNVFKIRGFDVVGVDPAVDIVKKANEKGIKTYCSLFNKIVTDEIVSSKGKAAIITAFNAFAHADDLDEIMVCIAKILDENGAFYFEAQYLLDLVDKVLIGSVFHEHMSHHSIKPLIPFFDKHGMKIVDAWRSNTQHGAIVGKVVFNSNKIEVSKRLLDIIRNEELIGLDKFEKISSLNKSICDVRNEAKKFVGGLSNKIVVGYGAARSSQTLIRQSGLQGIISYIVDDSLAKNGRYIAGEGIKVCSTDILLEKVPDYIVILAWVHAKRIILNNKWFLEGGGTFVVLSPRFSYVNIDNYLEYTG